MSKAAVRFKNDCTTNFDSLVSRLRDKKLEDRIWEQFCDKANKETADNEVKKKRFKKHPHYISNSSSDLLSSRNPSESSSSEAVAKNVGNLDRKFSLNSIGSASSDMHSDFASGKVRLRKENCTSGRSSQKKSKTQGKVLGNKPSKQEEEKGEVDSEKVDENKGAHVLKFEESKQRSLKKVTLVQDIESDSELDAEDVRVTEKSFSRKRFSKKSSHGAVEKASPVTVNKGSSQEVGESSSKEIKRDHVAIGMDNIESKLNHVIQKTLNCMEDIRLLMDAGCFPPDGTEDFERRKKRANEFASRFARNYLYQLNRQISEINKILRPTSGRISSRNISNVLQKLCSSYQTILQGLNAYHNHLPTTICIGVPDKVKELLKLSFVLCDIHRNCFSTDVSCNYKRIEIIDVFEVRSKCLLEKIEESCDVASTASLLHSNHSKYSLLGYNNCKEKMLNKKNVMKSRFSMYAGNQARKDIYWKRAVAALAKKKFNVQSRYKTACFKHRPPTEKPITSKVPLKAKVLEKKSSSSFKPSKNVLNEDDITTMVQVQREKDIELGVKDSTSDYRNISIKNEILAPLVEKMLEKINEEKKDMSQDQVKNILQGLVEMARTCDDGNQVQKIENANADIDELANKLLGKQLTEQGSVPGTTDDLFHRLITVVNKGREEAGCGNADKIMATEVVGARKEEVKRRERKQTITVTGVKNAKLICIRDDDSLIEPSEEQDARETVNSIKNGTPSDIELKPKASNKIPTNETANVQANVDVTDSKSSLKTCSCKQVQSKSSVVSERASRIKISRLPKRGLTTLKMLPKEYALNVLQYKIQFIKAKKGNPMYKKTANVQPWNLMGIIADNILEELLVSLGCEIQVNEVIEQIYASELK